MKNQQNNKQNFVPLSREEQQELSTEEQFAYKVWNKKRMKKDNLFFALLFHFCFFFVLRVMAVGPGPINWYEQFTNRNMITVFLIGELVIGLFLLLNWTSMRDGEKGTFEI